MPIDVNLTGEKLILEIRNQVKADITFVCRGKEPHTLVIMNDEKHSRLIPMLKMFGCEMIDVLDSGGFRLLIGDPKWVIQKKKKKLREMIEFYGREVFDQMLANLDIDETQDDPPIDRTLTGKQICEAIRSQSAIMSIRFEGDGPTEHTFAVYLAREYHHLLELYGCTFIKQRSYGNDMVFVFGDPEWTPEHEEKENG